MSMFLMDFVEQNDAMNTADNVGLLQGYEENYQDLYDDAGFSGETLTYNAMGHPCQLTVGYLMMGGYDE